MTSAIQTGIVPASPRWAAEESAGPPPPRPPGNEPARTDSEEVGPAMTQREAALRTMIDGMRRREEAALRDFYDATVARVFGLALRITRTPESAEDVVAEVYHQVWRSADRFDAARGGVLTWLLTLCRSRAIDHLRRRDEAESHADPESLAAPGIDDSRDPQNLLLAVERHSALYDSLAQLIPIQRQLLALAFFRGLSHHEVAEHLGMPLGTVKTHIRKALEVLRRALGAGGAGARKP